MSFTYLEGELTHLEIIDTTRIDELVKIFQQKDLHEEAGYSKPLSKERILEAVDDDNQLFIWEIFLSEDRSHLGYAVYVAYDGPPYVFLHFFTDDETQESLARDTLVVVIRGFFEYTTEEELYFFIDREMCEKFEGPLMDCGFDVDDTLPTINHDEEAAFVLLRTTYDVYYGEDSELEEVY
ncbi:MAG: hypothetical protein QGI45_07185 [Myxococcota bacterium]|nr:hypothetical protein [Myxococcota bacterium]